ncbi:2OG-Fe(II) oxygenase [Paenibacillus sp. NPDC056579]|uniref:2OG-Fe(II) oxygenase n=1 Tax=Paenibacillus sp. NPDC056579 TaxID=3345871 RepID=UPI00369D8A26
MKEPSVIFNEEPRVAKYENVLSGWECRQLIEMARNQLQPAQVIGEKEVITSEFRKSEFAWFTHQANDVVKQVTERVASIMGHPLHYAENLQVARYGVGGRFGAHLDTYDLSSVAGKRFYEEGGQRLYTALMYLNDVEQGNGGETYFPNLNFEVAPTEGTLLLFHNCYPNSATPHPLSMHGSRELKTGEKWIATLWFRDRQQYNGAQDSGPYVIDYSYAEEEKKSEPPTAVEKPVLQQEAAGKEQAAVKQESPAPSHVSVKKQAIPIMNTSAKRESFSQSGNVKVRIVETENELTRDIHIRNVQIMHDSISDLDKIHLIPNSVEMMLGALGSSIAEATVAIAADRGISVQSVEVEVNGQLDRYSGWYGASYVPAYLSSISYTLNIVSSESEDTILKLHNAVQRTSPGLQLIIDPQKVNASFVHKKEK